MSENTVSPDPLAKITEFQRRLAELYGAGSREVLVELTFAETLAEMAVEARRDYMAMREAWPSWDTIDRYTDALADVNCWLSGFIAGGGTYSPGTHEALKDLKSHLERMQGL